LAHGLPITPLDTTFLKAAAWLASEAAMSAVQVKESSLRDASPTPPMMGIKAAYTMGWSMSLGRAKRGIEGRVGVRTKS
jgi:hypothetical protein